MRASYLVSIGVLLLTLGAIGYAYFRDPPPVEDLILEEAAFDSQTYDGSIRANGCPSADVETTTAGTRTTASASSS